jgi:hypothetical protein
MRAPANSIFICYRPSDTGEVCKRLFEQIAAEFGCEAVFRARQEIPPGEDYLKCVEDRLSSARVGLVLIGDSWEWSGDPEEIHPLRNPADWVRIEIEAMLARPEIRVLPIFIDRRTEFDMSLPEVLSPLRRCRSFKLRAELGFEDDVQRLVALLRREFEPSMPLGAPGGATASAEEVRPNKKKTARPLPGGQRDDDSNLDERMQRLKPGVAFSVESNVSESSPLVPNEAPQVRRETVRVTIRRKQDEPLAKRETGCINLPRDPTPPPGATRKKETARLTMAPEGGSKQALPKAAIKMQCSQVLANCPQPRAGSTLSAGSSDPVNFSVFAPRSITPGSSFLLELWAHLANQTALVEASAREMGRERKIGLKAGVLLAPGTVLEATLELAGFELTDPNEPLVWSGEPANATFPVKVPAALVAGSYPGVIRLCVDAIPISRVHFTVEVGRDSPQAAPARLAGSTFTPRTAFACYSSEDRADVLGRIQGMNKVRPDLEVFVDVLELRSGQDWEKTIKPHLDSKDVFYLFWSKPAAGSKEVEKEWRYAFTNRGLDYIDPVPLVDPRVAPVPEELKQLHFGDRFLAHVDLHRRVSLAKKKRPWWKLFGA